MLVNWLFNQLTLDLNFFLEYFKLVNQPIKRVKIMKSLLLREEWNVMCSRWGASKEKSNILFDDLERRYSAKTRHYHSLSHIQAMFRMASAYQGNVDHWDSVFCAILFHDAIQGLSVDGEQASSVLCHKALTSVAAPQEVIQAAVKMILATKDHNWVGDCDTGFLLDLDMAILGARWGDYLAYAKSVRKEYVVPDLIYKHGRKRFLKSKLKLPSLFNTPWFQQQFENQARLNLARELALLSGVGL